MNNINSYIILNRKTKFITNIFILISIIIIIALLLITQLKYKKYYQTNGQVIKENNIYQLSLYLDPYKLKIFKNNNKIIINEKEYIYNIKSISDEYIISNDLKNYVKVILDINLNKEDKIVNNILNLKILESNKKIIYYLKDYFKKGVNNEKNWWKRIRTNTWWRI